MRDSAFTTSKHMQHQDAITSSSFSNANNLEQLSSVSTQDIISSKHNITPASVSAAVSASASASSSIHAHAPVSTSVAVDTPAFAPISAQASAPTLDKAKSQNLLVNNSNLTEFEQYQREIDSLAEHRNLILAQNLNLAGSDTLGSLINAPIAIPNDSQESSSIFNQSELINLADLQFKQNLQNNHEQTLDSQISLNTLSSGITINSMLQCYPEYSKIIERLRQKLPKHQNNYTLREVNYKPSTPAYDDSLLARLKYSFVAPHKLTARLCNSEASKRRNAQEHRVIASVATVLEALEHDSDASHNTIKARQCSNAFIEANERDYGFVMSNINTINLSASSLPHKAKKRDYIDLSVINLAVPQPQVKHKFIDLSAIDFHALHLDLHKYKQEYLDLSDIDLQNAHLIQNHTQAQHTYTLPTLDLNDIKFNEAELLKLKVLQSSNKVRTQSLTQEEQQKTVSLESINSCTKNNELSATVDRSCWQKVTQFFRGLFRLESKASLATQRRYSGRHNISLGSSAKVLEAIEPSRPCLSNKLTKLELKLTVNKECALSELITSDLESAKNAKTTYESKKESTLADAMHVAYAHSDANALNEATTPSKAKVTSETNAKSNENPTTQTVIAQTKTAQNSSQCMSLNSLEPNKNVVNPTTLQSSTLSPHNTLPNNDMVTLLSRNSPFQDQSALAKSTDIEAINDENEFGLSQSDLQFMQLLTSHQNSNNAELALKAKLLCTLGWRLAQCGAETRLIIQSVKTMAHDLGCSSIDLSLTREGIVLKLRQGQDICVEFREIKHFAINMDSLERLHKICLRVNQGVLTDPKKILLAIRAVRPRHYQRNNLIVIEALAAGAFAYLNGGSIVPVCVSAIIGGLILMYMRFALIRRGFFEAFAFMTSAFSGSFVAGLVCMLAFQADVDSIILASTATTLLLVPGFPLLNGFLDVFKGYVPVGVTRLVIAAVLIIAAALGLLVSTYLVELIGKILGIAFL